MSIYVMLYCISKCTQSNLQFKAFSRLWVVFGVHQSRLEVGAFLKLPAVLVMQDLPGPVPGVIGYGQEFILL